MNVRWVYKVTKVIFKREKSMAEACLKKNQARWIYLGTLVR